MGGIRRQSLEELLILFQDTAKNAMLSEAKVMMGHYIFSGEASDIHDESFVGDTT